MPLANLPYHDLTGPLVRGVGEGGVVSLPTPTRFVSNSASNGYASGANTGTGTTKAAPWLTLDYAIANASPGDVIEVNDGTYQAATFYNASDKTITIQSRRPGGVILQASDSQTRVINLNLVSTSRTITLINLTLDGRNNTTRGISLGSSSIALGVVAGLVIRNCTIKDCTTRYIDSQQQKSVSYNIAGLTVSGSIAGRPIFVQDAQDGAVTIDGLTFNTTMTAANFAGVEINRAAGSTGIAVSLSGIGGTLTASGAFVMNGVVVRNVDNAAILGSSLTIAGGAGSIGALYTVFSDSATLTANNAVVSGNGGANNCDSGYCVRIGTDSTGAGNNNHNNPLVENNALTANAASSQPIHGYMLGWGAGGTVRNNSIAGASHALLAKDWAGGAFSGNTASDFSYDGIYAKGATNTTFSGNTLNVTIANSQGVVRVGIDDTTLNSTGIVVSGCVLNINVDPPQVVTVGTSNTATFSGNTYNVNTTLGGATPWSYQGTGYASLAAWKAAKEPDAIP